MADLTSNTSSTKTTVVPMMTRLTTKWSGPGNAAHVQPDSMNEFERQGYFAITPKSGTGRDLKRLNRFFLQSFQKQLLERFQITEVFHTEKDSTNNPEITFFGSRTRQYVLTGIALNSKSGDTALPERYMWSDQLRKFYDEDFRATALVESDNVGKIVFGDNTWLCYPIGLSFTDDANNPHLSQFTMPCLVLKDYQNTYGVISSNATAIYKLTDFTRKDYGALNVLASEIASLALELNKLDSEIQFYDAWIDNYIHVDVSDYVEKQKDKEATSAELNSVILGQKYIDRDNKNVELSSKIEEYNSKVITMNLNTAWDN
jgi:hypothetical protein